MPPRHRRERPDVPPALLPALVPPALHGVKTRAIGATAPLRLNLLLYGLAGLIMPFVGIKLIGLIMHNLLGA